MAENQRPASRHHQSFWLWVMCLTGVDYFSTLGYQPSIAFDNTGRLAPLSTVLLVGITLFGALPVYAYVAGKSPHGLGSIGMLERLVQGWTGKILVLTLLGFAATDFIITKTLSAADAAVHLIENPLWPWPPTDHSGLVQQRIGVTIFLLVVLGAMFLRGFREVISLAVGLVVSYLTLNLIVISSALWFLYQNPDRVRAWYEAVLRGDWYLSHPPLSGHGWGIILLTCLWVFPKLALGLSGFETGVAVMPLIRGQPDDHPEAPAGRIRNTRKLLLTAAAIMSFFLLSSSLVVCTLIPPEDLIGPDHAQADSKPPARERALAYLAHAQNPDPLNPLFGEVFGTLYDLSTVAILWFAGASAMAGLLNLVPQYLPRYGMAPEWARAIRPLVILFTAINLVVTLIFRADPTAQGAAYATGVLALISSACVATVIDRWRQRSGPWHRRLPWAYTIIMVIFFYTTAANILEKPDGIKIASCFIAAIVVSSLISRALRSTELRFGGFRFKDEQSRFLWNSLVHLEFPVLVPHRPGGRDLAHKEESIRREHRLAPDVPIVFLEVSVGDASDFYQEPIMEVTQQEGRILLRVERAASISHTIAALALELSKVGKPPEIHFGWSNESPLAANLDFLLFGEGNVPWLVRELLLKAEPDPKRQPRVIIG